MKLFDIFKKKKPEIPLQELDGPTIFYHEDDFRQVEILPNKNYSNLKVESLKVDTFGKEHFDGTGFTSIYVRNDKNRIKLKDRQIHPKDLEAILSALGFDRIQNVLTGYDQSFREVHKNCIAFSKNYQTIFYDFEENIVQHIWLTNHWGIDREKFAKCLYELGQQWDLLLQDWNLTVTIDLSNKDLIDGYLATYDNE